MAVVRACHKEGSISRRVAVVRACWEGACREGAYRGGAYRKGACCKEGGISSRVGVSFAECGNA